MLGCSGFNQNMIIQDSELTTGLNNMCALRLYNFSLPSKACAKRLTQSYTAFIKKHIYLDKKQDISNRSFDLSKLYGQTQGLRRIERHVSYNVQYLLSLFI